MNRGITTPRCIQNPSQCRDYTRHCSHPNKHLQSANVDIQTQGINTDISKIFKQGRKWRKISKEKRFTPIHPRKVIAGVMQFLNYKIPAFVRVDCIQVSLSYPSKKKRYAKWKLRISSIHGNKAALPFIKSVEASFPDRPRVKSAFLTDQPFKLQRETLRSKPFKVFLKLNFGNGCDCSSVELDYPIDFQDSTEYFEHGKGNVIESLRNRALDDATCGHISPIQRKQMSDSKGTYTEYAIVTSLVRHEYMALEPKALTNNGTIEKRGIESIEVEAEDLGKRMKLES